MEFRHASWDEARQRCCTQGVAWCVAETDENDPEPDELSWEPVGYLRLRKTEYSDEEFDGVGGTHPAGARGRRGGLLLLQARGRAAESEDGQAPRTHPALQG